MHARFVLSAASASDFPRTGLPEVALVGRSNVGKSSLINALAKQKVARTSAAPGKTRLANYYSVGFGLKAVGSGKGSRDDVYLVDLPGYGYARGGADSVEEFEQLTREYFDPSRHQSIAGVLHLIDARHPNLPQDAAAFEWLIRTELPLAIVATKVDKLKQSEQSKMAKMLEQRYGLRVLPVSAMKGTGLDDVGKTIRTWTGQAIG